MLATCSHLKNYSKVTTYLVVQNTVVFELIQFSISWRAAKRRAAASLAAVESSLQSEACKLEPIVHSIHHLIQGRLPGSDLGSCGFNQKAM
jgi:hypothetical protein